MQLSSACGSTPIAPEEHMSELQNVLLVIFSFGQVVMVEFYSPAVQSYKLGMLMDFNSEKGFKMSGENL